MNPYDRIQRSNRRSYAGRITKSLREKSRRLFAGYIYHKGREILLAPFYLLLRNLVSLPMLRPY